MASRLANTEDSISHMDSKTPVLDVGSYERLLFMEASLAALSDSSPCMAERRRSAVQSLKRPSIPNVARDKPEWLFSVPPRLQTIENSMAVDPRALREHVYFSAEDRRRATVGLVKRGSVSDVSAGDSPLLAEVLGRLHSVVASLASVTISSDGERAAEDVEERLQAIEASLRGFKPTLDE